VQLFSTGSGEKLPLYVRSLGASTVILGLLVLFIGLLLFKFIVRNDVDLILFF
jgi:hypothetical protein